MSNKKFSKPKFTNEQLKNILPKWFRPAIVASCMADHWQHRIGAAIFVKRKLISVGWNQINKTHPLCLTYRKPVTMHAEVAALLKAKHNVDDFDDAFIVVFRVKKDGTPGMAKPCQGCQEILKAHGIKKAIWTAENEQMFEAGDL